jgi:hypothetical protein
MDVMSESAERRYDQPVDTFAEAVGAIGDACYRIAALLRLASDDGTSDSLRDEISALAHTRFAELVAEATVLRDSSA